MARTIKDIKRQMTDLFMADSSVRERYGVSGGDSFEKVFSLVSVESVIFYVVAVVAWTLETLFDAFRKDVDDKIGMAVVASVPWYHKVAKLFQYGDELVFDETTQAYRYATVDEEKRVVRYVAVKDKGGSIQLLVSTDKGGKPEPLTGGMLTAFKAYMNRVKIAGVVLAVRSAPADLIRMGAVIEVDPMLMDMTGKRLSDGSFPVVDAIEFYLANILYGGTFNKTKLVDAIQAVPGVVDVTLTGCWVKIDGASEYKDVEGNNYTAESGCFIPEALDETLQYVV